MVTEVGGWGHKAVEGSRTAFPGKVHQQIMHSWLMSVFPGWVQGQSLWLRLFPCLPHSLASCLPPACSPLDRYTLQTHTKAYTGNALKAREGIWGPSLCLGITECQIWKGPQKASGPTLLICKIGNRYRERRRAGQYLSTNSIYLVTLFLWKLKVKAGLHFGKMTTMMMVVTMMIQQLCYFCPRH